MRDPKLFATGIDVYAGTAMAWNNYSNNFCVIDDDHFAVRFGTTAAEKNADPCLDLYSLIWARLGFMENVWFDPLGYNEELSFRPRCEIRITILSTQTHANIIH